MLASDHGFGPTRDVFHVNSWLEQQGYLTWADARTTARRPRGHRRRVRRDDAPRPRAGLVAHRRLRGHAVQPGDPHRRPRPRQRGAAARRGARASSRRRSPQALREVAPPARRRGRWSRRCGPASRRSRGPSRSSAPTSRWCWPTAARSRSCPRETIVARRPEPRGHHRWEGIFIAAGPGIRAGASVEELSIVDVAPLLLHQLGLPVPEDMAGQRARRRCSSPASSSAGPCGARRRRPRRRRRARRSTVELAPRGAGRGDGATAGAGVRGVSGEVMS